MSWVETVLKVLLRVEPTALTLAIITIEIPAAIKQYSIAVAPDSSFKNARALNIRDLYARWTGGSTQSTDEADVTGGFDCPSHMEYLT